MTEKTDSQLVTEAIGGQSAAFSALVNRYVKQLYTFVYRLSGAREESNDIIQDVFLKVWKNLKKFDPKKNFKTWIYTIARNTAIDWMRKKKSVPFSIFDDEEGVTFSDRVSDSEPLPDSLFEKKELGAILEKGLSRISPHARSIILLHLTDGMTFEEIADMLQKPMNTVKSQYRRALLALRNHIEHAPK